MLGAILALPTQGPSGQVPRPPGGISLPPHRASHSCRFPLAATLPAPCLGPRALQTGLGEAWWLREEPAVPHACVHVLGLRPCVRVSPHAQEHEHGLRGCSCVCTFVCACEHVLVLRCVCWVDACECTCALMCEDKCVHMHVDDHVHTCEDAHACTHMLLSTCTHCRV